MGIENQSKLSQYLELFEQISSRVGDNTIAAVILQEIGKDDRADKMRTATVQSGNGRNSDYNVNGDQPASRKQIAYLKKLGYDTTDSDKLTRDRASELIDLALGKPTQ